MKAKSLKFTVAFILALIASCDEPETVVTDIVYPDGSVMRKIEMKNMANKFEISRVQVPFDSTWSIRDSLEINGKDTIWVKRAEKLFRNTDEINNEYITDSSYNRNVKRRAGFTHTFRWFNTEYRFSERVEKKLEAGYPVSDFLNQEEMAWFYSPESINEEKKNGPDSTRYRAFDDTIRTKTDLWATKSLVSEWIYVFSEFAKGKTGDEMSFESLKKRESEFMEIIKKADDGKFDSLWKNGILLKKFIGESNALKYKTEADTALAIVTNRFFVNFSDYTQRIVMPGILTGTNGVIDSAGVLTWPVQSDYFMSEDYTMWAESRTPNRWAWIVTGIFLLFVLAGIIFRALRKKNRSA